MQVMQAKKLSIGLRATLAFFAVTLFVAGTAASQEKVIRSFNNSGRGGYNPGASLIFDTVGNLYGTTFNGGVHGAGTVFQLTPTANGGWTEKVLHAFGFNGTDGINPYAGLIFDAAGNLYGTTYEGSGTVFELTPRAGGGWTEKVLHTFDGADGYGPQSSLIFDAAGNLYGTTYTGGAHSSGTVFELTPTAGERWTESVLHSFNSNGTDGTNPEASMVLDAAGNLYGTTAYGGAYGAGTVFELTPAAGGSWTETVLKSFNSSDTNGYLPQAGLIFDASGNLYGTTAFGGAYFSYGTVFELSPTADGTWTETVLHNFNSDGTDGTHPQASLIFDAADNLYGTTESGGSGACNTNGHAGCGIVFELTPTAGGDWTETVLSNFHGRYGINPAASLIFDAAGNLYGTTFAGGAYKAGAVFKLTP